MRRRISGLDIEKIRRAAREVSTKSQAQINLETAETWACRALAYRQKAEQADAEGHYDAAECWRGFADAQHEALEHAALVGDGGKTVGRIERLMRKRRRR